MRQRNGGKFERGEMQMAFIRISFEVRNKLLSPDPCLLKPDPPPCSSA